MALRGAERRKGGRSRSNVTGGDAPLRTDREQVLYKFVRLIFKIRLNGVNVM